MPKTYGPSQVSHLSGVPAEMLRDWRRRGLVDKIGRLGDNGRWEYRTSDIIMLAVVRLIGPSIALHEALEMASRAVEPVRSFSGAWRAHVWDDKMRKLRFVVMFRFRELDPQFEYFTEFAAIEKWKPASFVAVDCQQVAAELSALCKALAAADGGMPE